jgi:hypothetical protein
MSREMSDDGQISIQEKKERLESRGLQVHLSRTTGGGKNSRFYCRLRNRTADVTFFGDSPDEAIDKAVSWVQSQPS